MKDNFKDIPAIDMEEQGKKLSIVDNQGNSISKQKSALASSSTQYQKDVDSYIDKSVRKSYTPLEILFQLSKYREVKSYQTQLFRLASEDRLNRAEIMNLTRSKQLAELCNAGLQISQAESKKRVSSFFLAQLAELKELIDAMDYTYMDKFNKKMKYINSFKDTNPDLHKAYMKRCLQELDEVIQASQIIVTDFINILNQKIETRH